MSDPKSTSRSLRAFFATLATICLIGAGVAYGVTRYRLMELEEHATRDAHKVAVDVIEPELTPHDASAPMSGERLASMRSKVEARVLTGPVNAVRIWSGDGVIVFADDPAQMGESEPAMRDDIHALTSGTTTEDFVTGERFHSLVVLHVGRPKALMAVEIVRSHSALVDKAQEPWYPWVARALQLAALFAVLWVLTWIGFLAYSLMKRGVERHSRARNRKKEEAPGRRPSSLPEDLPAYTQPGFREEVESRRLAEQELTSAKAERDELAGRLQQVELELQQSQAPAGSKSS